MHAEERRELIAEETAQRGRVSVSRLAARFEVTPETIRRDLVEMEERGLLRRVHGGAVSLDPLRGEQIVTERAMHMAAEKERIAKAALDLLPHEGTLLLDAGTTTAALADAFPSDRRLTVVTNAVPIALRLAPVPGVTVVTIGGRLRPQTLACVDDFATRLLAELRVDVAFVATNGVTERGCSTADPAEAAVKRAMVSSADRIVLLADHTKFGQEHFVRFAALDDLDVVVTDREIDGGDLRMLERAGLEVRTA